MTLLSYGRSGEIIKVGTNFGKINMLLGALKIV